MRENVGELRTFGDKTALFYGISCFLMCAPWGWEVEYTVVNCIKAPDAVARGCGPFFANMV